MARGWGDPSARALVRGLPKLSRLSAAACAARATGSTTTAAASATHTSQAVPTATDGATTTAAAAARAAACAPPGSATVHAATACAAIPTSEPITECATGAAFAASEPTACIRRRYSLLLVDAHVRQHCAAQHPHDDGTAVCATKSLGRRIGGCSQLLVLPNAASVRTRGGPVCKAVLLLRHRLPERQSRQQETFGAHDRVRGRPLTERSDPSRLIH